MSIYLKSRPGTKTLGNSKWHNKKNHARQLRHLTFNSEGILTDVVKYFTKPISITIFKPHCMFCIKTAANPRAAQHV